MMITDPNINSNARIMEMILIEPMIEYLDEEDNEDRMTNDSAMDWAIMNTMMDIPISTLNNGCRIDAIRKENSMNRSGNNRNDTITADFGNWMVEISNENALIKGAVNP